MNKEIKLAVLPGVYMRKDPGSPMPVVFDIPRSGTEFPRWFTSDAPLAAIQRSISSYVEELYHDVTDAGATWLYASFPTPVIDPNRQVNDIEHEQIDGSWPETLIPSKARTGIGLFPALAGGQPLYSSKITIGDALRRLNELYLPYHTELARLLQVAKQRDGVAYHLSCHSMAGYVPNSGEGAGERRSDFDLGDRNGSTCEPGLVDVVSSCLKSFGYEVTTNKYFIGAEAVRKHGDPAKRIHSLQIEMNRTLYMNEKTREKTADFEKVRAHMAILSKHVVAYARSKGR